MAEFKISVGAQLDASAISNIKSQLDNMNAKVKVQIDTSDIQKAGKSVSNLSLARFGEQINSALRNTTTGFKQVNGELTNLKGKFDSLKISNLDTNQLEKLKVELIDISAKAKDANASSQLLRRGYSEMASAAKSVDTANSKLTQLDKYMETNTKAARKYAEVLQQVRNEYLKIVNSNGAEGNISKANSDMLQAQRTISANGDLGKSFGDQMKAAASSFSTWIGVGTVVMGTIHTVRNAFNEIIALDDAMVELRKVTEATSEQFNTFYNGASSIAIAMGQTTESIISQTAEWAQLGYAIDEATQMAQESSLLATVSPEMTVEESTQALISTMKAFDVATEDVRSQITDKINIVGNNYASNNSDIAAILQRSSAAMAAANNSIEQTIALGTGANEIVQDADIVGTALKTISMRIRAMDEETETYDATLASAIGGLQDLAGISVFTDETQSTYKSTYDVLKDIAEVWDTLTDSNQASITEALFGKRQANQTIA